MILTPTTGPDDWKRGLADPVKHWRRGYSARTLAHCWEAARGLPVEIAALFGGKSDLLLAIPEHKVPLPGGRRESQSDVFALIRVDDEVVAAAIEGKVDEPFGPTVSDWLVNASPGKIERLESICDLLGLPSRLPGHLHYQLLHRAASAVLEARRFNCAAAAMIVHSFSPTQRWFDAYASFVDLMETSAAHDELVTVSLPDGMPLHLAWATGDPSFLER